MKHIKYLLIAMTLLSISCTKQNSSNKASALPVDQAIVIPSCGSIKMTPPNSIYAPTNVTFESSMPTGQIQEVQWVFKKNDVLLFSSSENTVNHIFNNASEGYGSYTAQLTFKRLDGNICALEQAFQVLKDDICVKPTGISGPTIGYVGDEVEFSVDSEPCFFGSLKWDMNGDDVTDMTTETTEGVKYTYTQPGIYTIKTIVLGSEDDQAFVLTHSIEIKNKMCLNPFTNTPVEDGKSVTFAKKSLQCGENACDTLDRVCSNGTFGGDSTFTENPAVCEVSAPCAPVLTWVPSQFGQCTGPCDSENGTRKITNYVCKSTQGGTTLPVPDSLCVAQIGAKPTDQSEACTVAVEDQPLNCLSCGDVPHHGDETKWASSSCGVPCTSQTVTCNNGVLPPFDPGYIYDSQAACPVTACPPVYTYSWKVSDYGSCSAVQCGTQGTQTRSVTCVRNDGTTVVDTYCTGEKPSTTKTCSARECYSCNLPWGGIIDHKKTVTAFDASSVPCGTTCKSQTRTCVDGVLSGSYTKSSCSVATCTTPTAKGSSCLAFMGSSIKWKDPKTGKSCGGNLLGSLVHGDYLEIGGSEIDPNTNWMIPWDKAKYRGSAKVICSETITFNGIPTFQVESGTCEKGEPNLVSSPQVGATTPSTCYESPVSQQPYGNGACAVYRITPATDMPLQAVLVNSGVKKYPDFGEYTESFKQLYSSTKGNLSMAASINITYKGETRTLGVACGNTNTTVPSNSTCKNSSSVLVGGVTFTMGVGARNTIDPDGYVPPYVSGFPNTSEVWSQRTCGVVTLSSSLGYLPRPCPNSASEL